MKKKISQWWFTVMCYLAGIFTLVICFVDLFIDEEAFYKTTQFIGGAVIPAIIWITIGEMNKPDKEKINEKEN